MEAVPPDGRGMLEHLLIPYRPAAAVTQIVEDMKLCYCSGFQGRVYANNVFAFIVVVVWGGGYLFFVLDFIYVLF